MEVVTGVLRQRLPITNEMVTPQGRGLLWDIWDDSRVGADMGVGVEVCVPGLI